MSKSILVAGGTGFVGRHVMALFDQREVSVKALVRDVSTVPSEWRKSDNISIVVAPSPWTPETIRLQTGSATTIVNLAGLAHQRNVHSDALAGAHQGLTDALIGSFGDPANARFIHLSSIGAVTGSMAPNAINDFSAPAPQTEYGRAKRKAEISVEQLAKQGAMAISLRPPLVVGRDGRGNWARLVKLARTRAWLPLGGIGNRRSLCTVETLARAIVHLCTVPWEPTQSGNYAIADDPPLATDAIISLLRQGMGRPPHLIPFPHALKGVIGAMPGVGLLSKSLLEDLVVDASRFRETFGFSAGPSLPGAIVRIAQSHD